MSSLGPFEENTIVVGDCIEVMAQLPDACVDAIVTDPPYGFRFMGKAWDTFDIQRQTERDAMTRRFPRPDGRKVSAFQGASYAGLYDQSLSAHLNYQQWTTAWATEAYRILKPGAYMLVMGGCRTHHRLGCGLEDAGFEIRDELAWIYASGFPKNYDVSKGIDKRNRKTQETYGPFAEYLKERRETKGLSMAEIDRILGTNTAYSWWEGRASGIQLPSKEHYLRLKEILGLDNRFDQLIERIEAERKVLGEYLAPDGKPYSERQPRQWTPQFSDNKVPNAPPPMRTEPSLPEAQYWEGYGTALKPAHEPIWLCKKPNEGTYVDNVLKYGCGAMNIDGCRIEYQGDSRAETGRKPIAIGSKHNWTGERASPYDSASSGRWPANVLVDCYPEEFQGGVVIEGEGKPTSGKTKGFHNVRRDDGYGFHAKESAYTIEHPETEIGNGLLGPYTRFFVIPKPSKAEKTCNGKVENKHVTVKPVRLGKWLIKLITPHQHPVVVLDLFCGSGSFLVSAQELNFEEGYQIEFYGIDKGEDSVETARARVEAERAGRQLGLL